MNIKELDNVFARIFRLNGFNPVKKKKMKRKITDYYPLSKKLKLETTEERILKLAKRGRCMYVGGCAGTGKSYLIGKLKEELFNKEVYITALTGIASINIKGTTLHRFTGTGIENEYQKMLARVHKGRSRLNWTNCEILIIDEVSMMGKNFFENLNKISKKVRKNKKFFGGIQLILLGDFFQLPPIHDEYLFKSEIFLDKIQYWFELENNYRQTDNLFRKILKEVRFSNITEDSIKILEKITEKKINGVRPTILYSTRKNVNQENKMELDKLNYETRTFKSEDYILINNRKIPIKKPLNKQEEFFKGLLNNSLYREILNLKKDAQVILIKNMEDGKLVNGLKGQVLGFKKFGDDIYPVVKFDGVDEDIVCRPVELKVRLDDSHKYVVRKQIPLILAWALTVHKCQGLTLNNVIISMEDIFENGQFYVALSRVKSLDGLYLKDFNKNKIRTNKDVIDWFINFFVKKKY